MDACTIIAKNYVAQARVLARSFAEHHPDGRFWTLIIDDFEDHLDPANEPFEVLTPADIGCEPFLDMAMRYNVLELSTAVKPWLLRHLMAAVSGPITYLDPDIQVFGSLTELDDLARAHGLALTPHNSKPIPADGRRPTQIDIMIAGVYNLGYVSIAPGEETGKLLDWWEDRLRRDCRVDPVYGYFVDQRWFDLAPGFLSDIAIVREPQYNVAYWNLHSRTLARDGDSWSVDTKPLAFFHFSGFDPDEPDVLSRHQDRVDPRSDQPLREILSGYAALVQNDGYATARRLPYTFDALNDGTRLDPVVRKMFAEAEELGEVSLSPFTPEGSEAFFEWLAAPSPGAPPGVHRLLARLYGVRSDLKEAFPDLSGPDLDRLFQWSRREGAEEVPALARLPLPDFDGSAKAPTQPQPQPRAQSQRPPLWGVNVVGHFRSELGIGEAARQVIVALDAVAVPVQAVRGTTQPLSRQGHAFDAVDNREAQFGTNVICVNADMLPDFAGGAGRQFFANRYNIGLWFWEVSRFRTEWQGSFALLDEVWAPTAHIADALAPVSPIPIVPMRIPVQMASVVPRSRAELGVPEGFFFLFSFDYLSVFERKNPLGVVEAFTRAFPAGRAGPSLVLKCINAEHDPGNHAKLLAAAGESESIHVIDRYLDPADKDSLMATCDCYVSLHRSEGFGLTMAEAMYVGKPVIATGYSGNLDFMTHENSLLVDYASVPIGPGLAPYPAEGEWAEPDLEHAAALMRLVAEDPEAARQVGARGAEDIHRTHSPDTVGAMMRERLELVRPSASQAEGRGSLNGGGPHVAAALAPRIERGPGTPAGLAPSRSVNRLARRGALRLMRPFTAYQQTVNEELLQSLDWIDGDVAAVSDRQTLDGSLLQARVRLLERLLPLTAITAVHGQATDELKGSVFELGARVDSLESEAESIGLQTDRELYAALASLSARYRDVAAQPSGTRDGPLTPFELRVFSQNGEDGVLAEILTRIGYGGRCFVEFGAESGTEANCVHLADVQGWDGLFMDCDEQLFPALERKYRARDGVRTVKAEVTVENLEALLDAHGIPSEPDVFSIDVDGSDYWLWNSLESYRPRVLVIEYNSSLDPSRKLVQPADAPPQWDGTDYYGASLGALRSLGERKGYRLVHTELCGVNAFFVREDLAGERFPRAEDVHVRGFPNYFQLGHHHPRHVGPSVYLDLDLDALVDLNGDPE
jgi:glycosyltransferase involved in cell wall biosynthesis